MGLDLWKVKLESTKFYTNTVAFIAEKTGTEQDELFTLEAEQVQEWLDEIKDLGYAWYKADYGIDEAGMRWDVEPQLKQLLKSLKAQNHKYGRGMLVSWS